MKKDINLWYNETRGGRMKQDNSIIEKEYLTKEEVLEKNKTLLKQHTMPIDENTEYISGCLGNKEDVKKANFPGVYVIIENNHVIYIGSALPNGRTIKVRFSEHLHGHPSHTKIIPCLIETRGISKEEAKRLIRTFEFIAFKYISLEYSLINNTPGLINSSGNYK